MQDVETYSVAYGLYRLIVDHPEWERPLAEAVAWEEAHPVAYPGDGWQFHDIHVARTMTWSWNADCIADCVSKSRAYQQFRLSNLPATKEAIAMLRAVPDPEQAPMQVDDLFGYVIGHEKAKYLLLRALKADVPVHCLLVGPVGTAKSLMLDDIAKLENGHYYAASNTTKAGLVGFLVEMKPSILCLDELDKMQSRDMTPLLNLMETGKVTRLHANKREVVQLATRVFASANDVARLPAPIVSRFLKINIPQYTEGEFGKVARQVLMQHPDILMGAEMALLVASEVGKHSLDIRDAVRVGKLAKHHPSYVFEVIAATWPDDMPRLSDKGGITRLPRR